MASTAQKTCVIYALCDPITNGVRYVGKADDMAKRLKSHLLDARRRQTPVYDWIRSLQARGLQPTIQEIETVPIESWAEREVAVIAEVRGYGVKLLNLSPGGDQPGTSPEQLKRCAATMIRKVAAHTPYQKRLHQLAKSIALDITTARRRGDTETLTHRIGIARKLGARFPDRYPHWIGIEA